MFSAFFVFGAVSIFLGIALGAASLVIALRRGDHLGSQSYFLGVVWGFLILKWAAQLAYFSRKYGATVSPCRKSQSILEDCK